MKQNYQKLLERTLEAIPEGKRPLLLLHSCCAPCSSYVLEYLTEYFDIVIDYYNPNIAPAEEFDRRLAEQRRLVQEMGLQDRVRVVAGEYEQERFYAASKGLEKESEGGARCTECFRLRLTQAAQAAVREHADFFTTTLTISPHKDAERINNLGAEISAQYGVAYLHSDFKKREGFKRSTVLSEEYGLYRQDYCGCVFSKRESEARKAAKEAEAAQQ